MEQQQFSRTQFPNQGWLFEMPAFGWKNPMPLAWTFDRTVEEIIKVRMKNSALTLKHGLATDATRVGNELENYTRARLGLPTITPVPPKTMPPVAVPPPSLGAAVSAVVKIAQGNALLMDWIPTGVVVSQELANRRAQTCVACPKNGTDSWTKIITGPLSGKIKAMLEKRIEMKLSTPFDDQLKACDVCLCPLTLKSFVPLDVILKHTSASTMAEFPPNCWIARRDG